VYYHDMGWGAHLVRHCLTESQCANGIEDENAAAGASDMY